MEGFYPSKRRVADAERLVSGWAKLGEDAFDVTSVASKRLMFSERAGEMLTRILSSIQESAARI